MSGDPSLSGYSTQALVSLSVAEAINGGRIRVWFARDFYAGANDSMANPHAIDGELAKAARAGSHTEKSADVEGNLLLWIKSVEDKSGGVTKRTLEARLLVNLAIFRQMYEPVVYYLRDVTGWIEQPGADEYTVEDVEIESGIAEPILPPPALRGKKKVGRY